MDEYGVYEPGDGKELAEKLKQDGAIVFPYTQDHHSAYVIVMANRFTKLGTMPFGGNPKGSTMVGLVYQGVYWFDLTRPQWDGYVAEKLRIGPTDGVHVAGILNEIGEALYGR